jgi:hypothetical protein
MSALVRFLVVFAATEGSARRRKVGEARRAEATRRVASRPIAVLVTDGLSQDFDCCGVPRFHVDELSEADFASRFDAKQPVVLRRALTRTGAHARVRPRSHVRRAQGCACKLDGCGVDALFAPTAGWQSRIRTLRHRRGQPGARAPTETHAHAHAWTRITHALASMATRKRHVLFVHSIAMCRVVRARGRCHMWHQIVLWCIMI